MTVQRVSCKAGVVNGQKGEKSEKRKVISEKLRQERFYHKDAV
jgi:hypothetical protein